MGRVEATVAVSDGPPEVLPADYRLRTTRRPIAWRGAKIDEPGLGCWMSQGQGLADAHAQSPQILGAKAGVIDPAGVLGATGLGCLA